MSSPDETAGDAEPKVELHSRSCSCGGGSWVILGRASSAPCGAAGAASAGAILTLAEWRAAGKPNSSEAYEEREERIAPGERREFKRYAASLPVTLRRIPTWRDKAAAQSETTETEVVAQGGSLVRTRMAVEEGEILLFELGTYKTKAQVLYMTHGSEPDGTPYLRLGVRFLDDLLPESLIPPGAELLD